MRLLKLADVCLFEERTPRALSHAVSIRIPEGYTLVLNETERFTAREGYVHLPLPHIKEGENTLRLEGKTGNLRSEGILRAGGLITPMPLPTEALLYSLVCAVNRLSEESQAHKQILEDLQAEKSKKRLFS